MPNGPFRVASWALLISVGLCLAAAWTNTQDLRRALSYSPANPSDHRGLADQPAIQLGTPQAFPASGEPARPASRELGPRTASLDPVIVSPVVQPPEYQSSANPSVVSAQSNTLPIERGNSSHRDVPVPDPYLVAQVEESARRESFSAEPTAPIEEPHVIVDAAPTDAAPAQDETLFVPFRSATADNETHIDIESVAKVDPNQFLGPSLPDENLRPRGIFEELPPPPEVPVTLAEIQQLEATAELEAMRRELAELKAAQTLLQESLNHPSDDGDSLTLPPSEAWPSTAVAQAHMHPGERRRIPGVAEESLVTLNPPVDAPPRYDPTSTGFSVHRDGIHISASDRSGLWNVECEAATLRDVLLSLGTVIGWNVVVDPSVQGEFTGSFQNADAQQSLAVLVKAYQLHVERRGDYLLVTTHEAIAR
ncbi:MAG: hypothetical protein KDA58_03515 [Planctomycetaceae bacterium]|nr:hypothetical protein [Planctomycetaceae bacterium]